MSETAVVRAVYDDYQTFERALHCIKQSEFKCYEAYGPIDLEEVSDLMPKKGSTVRVWATLGGIFGLVSFYLMCTISSHIYNLIVGGKPPISNVPFVVLCYEGTILLGAIAAFIAVLRLAKLSPRVPSSQYDPKFGSDSFGLVVECRSKQQSKLIELLKSSGASEVNELK